MELATVERGLTKAMGIDMTGALAGKPSAMRRVLTSSATAASAYVMIAIALVLAARGSGRFLWAFFVTYVGPGAFFVAIVITNRRAFQGITNTALRWTVLVGACLATTAVVGFLVFVVAVNAHLLLGGQL